MKRRLVATGLLLSVCLTIAAGVCRFTLDGRRAASSPQTELCRERRQKLKQPRRRRGLAKRKRFTLKEREDRDRQVDRARRGGYRKRYGN